MKQLYISILFFIFGTFVSQAQIVNIPDPVFKAKLVNRSPAIDTNGDGEIQVSEALVVTSLGFSMCEFDNLIGIEAFTNLERLSFGSYCEIASAVDLTGLNALNYLAFNKSSIPGVNLTGLTSLETISVGYCNPPFLNIGSAVNLKSISYYISALTDLDLSQNINLKTVTLTNTHLESLNVNNLAQLEELDCNGNNSSMASIDLSDLASLKRLTIRANLTSIDLSQNPLLEGIDVSSNSLTSLNISNLPQLKNLTCNANQLTSLNIANNPNLLSLYCSGNQFTALNLSNATNLEKLNCSDNRLTAINLLPLHELYQIDVSNNLFTTLDFSGQIEPVSGDTPNYTIRDNPNLTSVNLKNGKKDFTTINNINCPRLVYLCADDVDMENLNWALVNYGIANLQVNTYCSFVPGGNYNTITGTLSFDFDNNGCNTGDPTFANTKLKINGTDTIYTNATGVYNFYTLDGSFVVAPEITNPYFTISPASATVTFADGNNNTQVQNFCITPNGTHNDLEITLIPTAMARPGFDAKYEIVYHNKGNQMASGDIDLTFNDSVLDFVTASPALSAQSTNHLTWSYSDLKPFESRSIHFSLNVNSPQEIPPVLNGDILTLIANINTSAEDETVADNTFVLSQTVLGSYDPNDKTCLQGTAMTPEKVGEYLDYVIRFQNSGTFYAENIVVKDMIDTSKFDISSLKPIGSSHPYTVRITGNKVEFIFEHINLPAENDDEPGSHGFVAFKIKTKSNLVVGNSVSNKADIYFDYNFPIETEPAVTTVALLSKNTFEDRNVLVYPNPAKDKVHISAKDKITSVQLFDVQGRLVETVLENDTNISFDLSKNTAGVYFLKVFTEKGINVEKVIKQE